MNYSIEGKRKLLKKLYKIAQHKECDMKISSKSAQERANEAEGATKSRYDTFKEEGQYLAGGLKIRHQELVADICTIRAALSESFVIQKRVSMYSIVEVEYEAGNEKKLFIVPVLGGEIIDDEISLITPQSPIGKAIWDKEEGSEFELSLNNRSIKGEIISIV